jgi:hypothetical protein
MGRNATVTDCRSVIARTYRLGGKPPFAFYEPSILMTKHSPPFRIVAAFIDADRYRI